MQEDSIVHIINHKAKIFIDNVHNEKLLHLFDTKCNDQLTRSFGKARCLYRDLYPDVYHFQS
jgi:hypothetical protein